MAFVFLILVFFIDQRGAGILKALLIVLFFIWNLQQMVEVIRAFCWHQKFAPKGFSTLAHGLYTCIESFKMCLKSYFKEIVLKLAANGQNGKGFLLTSTFIPKGWTAPALVLYTCIKASKYIPGERLQDHWSSGFRLPSGFVNPRKWCSARLRLGEHHFLGLTNLDVNLKRMHQLYIEPRHEKTCFSHMRTTKVQISLRTHTVWWAPLLFAAWIVYYLYLL